jgi:hypothetical protein
MPSHLAKLYEKAWNETVNGLSKWKKNIIINNFPYEARCDADVSKEVARKAARLAERWYDEMEAVPSGSNGTDTPF